MDTKEFCSTFIPIEMDEVEQELASYGNGFYVLTCDDLEHLMNGGVIYDRDEYGTFIRMDEEAVAMLHGDRSCNKDANGLEKQIQCSRERFCRYFHQG